MIRKVFWIALSLLSSIRSIDSPVMLKELRARMRGARTFMVMGIYISVLGLLSVGYLLVMAIGSGRRPMLAGYQSGSAWLAYNQMGHELFIALAITQLSLVVMFAPGLTCSSFSGEWEQRTLEGLLLTTIPSRTIILGKFYAAFYYIGLLLFCSMPIFAITFMLGGVSPLEIALIFLLTAIAGLFFLALGLLSSVMCKRTYTATALSYGLMIFWIIGLPTAALDPIGMLLFGGLPMAGILTAAARWWLPRWRKDWKPERHVYLMIFGFSYCAITACMHVGAIMGPIADFLQAMNPFYALLGYGGGYHGGFGYGYTGPLSFTAPPLIFSGLALLGTLGALLCTITLFRVIRAPQADPLEVQDRVAQELSAPPPLGEVST
jgi:ABC-type transport system involved in multi-copper enzyme maturation permease subunit